MVSTEVPARLGGSGHLLFDCLLLICACLWEGLAQVQCEAAQARALVLLPIRRKPCFHKSTPALRLSRLGLDASTTEECRPLLRRPVPFIDRLGCWKVLFVQLKVNSWEFP